LAHLAFSEARAEISPSGQKVGKQKINIIFMADISREQLEVINITNIDDDPKGFDGMFSGEPYHLDPGETKAFVRYLGEHLANQLANKILIRGERDWNDPGFKQPLLNRIIGQVAVKVSEPDVPIEAEVKTEEPIAEEEFTEAPKDEEPIKAPELESEKKKRGRPRRK